MPPQIAKLRKNLNSLFVQNAQTTEINLESCQLTSLDPLLQCLSQFKNLKVLRLQNNALNELPRDMSDLLALQYLDLTQNRFTNLESFMSGLFSLKQLKHLFIDLKDEDEDEIIISLTNLESFNGTPLTDVPDDLEIGVGDDNHVLNFGGDDSDEVFGAAGAHQDAAREYVTDKNASDQIDPSSPEINVEHIDFALQEQLFEDSQRHLGEFGKWEIFSDPAKDDLKTSLLNETSPIRQQAEILSCKRHLTNDCFDQIIDSLNDDKLVLMLKKIRDSYDGLFDESYNTMHNTSRTHEDSVAKLRGDLNQADKEIGQLLEAAEILEKEASDSESAKRKLADIYEDEKEKLVDELGWIKAEKEKLKNKMRQYQIAQQKMSTQANTNTRELLVQTLKNERRKKSASNGAGRTLNTSASSSPSSKVGKHLTLRQVKEIIEDIYASKAKFDSKCADNHLPRETMEQHLYTYLNQKYGLKNLILDWASAIIAAVKKYSAEDNYVCVFGKILRNEIDEEFRFVQKQLLETVGELLRVYLKGKYPLKVDNDINAMLQKRMGGFVYEEEWVDIIKYMYNKEDSVSVIVNVKEAIRRYNQYNRSNDDGSMSARSNRSRAQGSSSAKNQNRILYSEFVKVLLDFQLNGHKRFLNKFVKLFRMFDQDRNGILNELEFRQLLLAINPNRSEEEIDELLNMMDPYNNQQITFSECVTFLSAELVRMMNTHRAQNKKNDDYEEENGEEDDGEDFDDQGLDVEYDEDEGA
uniref:EF-hand domain-containing protein n=1 Tax=Percolomonas cosmopolitus TaxID=63605 RepID=A0A7S1KQN4_9EUKA|mmetsp:Transcript_5496/g.20627  ORF Transcript_5496/g.20627 Transcript_5496/m.20627 type:complete len:753 (+) Transcript_5496:269-2527(+)|eukprot:CAMPEP_0117441382 /NCGR_PEP_ID=MMETSP0759-20121206/3607_1 /TAXON_ID=63605 /ORGANISM="Percolomonas cosmopolitus, Strain WS" /LENGTH=752 /DNA_ID=CAMNT_0005233237 /DNA_START=226 /DNA_END=2484 /DNA_ORIENTATION=+